MQKHSTLLLCLLLLLFVVQCKQVRKMTSTEYKQAKQRLYNQFYRDLAALEQQKPVSTRQRTRFFEAPVVTAKYYIYTMPLPAIVQDDQVKLRISQNQLHVSVHGEKQVQLKHGYAAESFSESKSFTLPGDAKVEKIFHKLRKHKLYIYVPRNKR